MKALITGVTGFVGKYLAQHLIDHGYEVWGTTRNSSPVFHGLEKSRIICIDFDIVSNITDLINEVKPDFIFHLAGQSSVKYSWNHKEETIHTNFIKTIHLLEGIKNSSVSQSVKILTVGSSEEYGNTKQLPIKEDNSLNPTNPYGISKLPIYSLGQLYFNTYGLQIIHVRPFNHIGPYQSLGFVTTDFAKQIVDIERGIIPPVIKVGNLNSQRDFTDVRDIVNAYEMLLKGGQFGEVYNVCSNKPVLISEILEYFVEKSRKRISIEIDENKLRPIDIPIYIGSNRKIQAHVGWLPKIKLDHSLIDILNYWRGKQSP